MINRRAQRKSLVSLNLGRVGSLCGLLGLVVVLPLLILLLSGCAGAPVKAPRSDLFGQMLKPEMVMAAPAPLPARPSAQMLVVDGTPHMAFDAAGAQRLIARDEVSEHNTELALACSLGFNEVTGAYSVLLEHAQAQERMYNLLGQKWAEAEAQLQRDQLAHETESWLNRVLLLFAFGLAL